MTFVIGFKCADGIVLCTDSLEADGLTKRSVDKIRVFGTSDWSVAIAGAGASGMIDKFCDEVSANAGQAKYNRRHIEQVIEEVLSKFRSKYQEDEDRFRILVGMQCTRVIDYRLYRSDSSHLAPIKDHAHIGTGHSLWRFLCSNLYAQGNSVEDNSRLAIFIMRQAINYVDGVDGPIRLARYTFGDQDWKLSTGTLFMPLNRYYESGGVSPFEVGTVLKDSWKLCNPPSLSEQVKRFGGVKIPGDELIFLNGVKLEQLRTVSGRKKAGGTFWSNRDRLRKRGLLEQEREKEQSQNQ
jgi:20S proteasome alpha/beta subunit